MPCCRVHPLSEIAYIIHKTKLIGAVLMYFIDIFLHRPPPLYLYLHSMLRMAMCLQNPQEKGLQAPLQIDFVRVGSRYRVGKLLGFGGSGAPTGNSDSSLTLL